MKLTIDPVTGMAGDMFVAALIDAGAGEDAVLPVMRCAARLLGGGELSIEKTGSGDVIGTRLHTAYADGRPGIDAETVREMLEAVYREYDFSVTEKKFADRAYDALCRAEARAHNRWEGARDEPERRHDAEGKAAHVHLHEAQDILVDVCGAARALSVLDVEMAGIVCLSPVYYGGGAVAFSHGVFPVPAPATREIIALAGLPVREGPVSGELLTPTGAAVLAALEPGFLPRGEPNTPARAVVGVGLGTLEFGAGAGVVNGLRVFLMPS